MKLSFYTIDDLRLGYDPHGINGWCQSYFLSWQSALTHYRSLPATGIKALGVTNGIESADLIHCLPLSPSDKTGEDIFISAPFRLYLWSQNQELLNVASEFIAILGIRYCLFKDEIIPAPTPPRCKVANKYLWGDDLYNGCSAIRTVYVAGIGWLTPNELERRFPTADRQHHYPVVMKYRADGITQDGIFTPLELTPWEFRYLESKTIQHIQEIKSRRNLQ